MLLDGVMIEIPDTIKDLHPGIHLSTDYFFVQGIAFLHSISRGYNYRTVEHHESYNKRYKQVDMAKGIKKCINMYHKRGLTVTQLNTDNEFGCIEDDILPTRLNMVAANEHVGDIEVSIKTTKECCRCHVHRNPYEWYTQLMVAGCVTSQHWT